MNAMCQDFTDLGLMEFDICVWFTDSSVIELATISTDRQDNHASFMFQSSPLKRDAH